MRQIVKSVAAYTAKRKISTAMNSFKLKKTEKATKSTRACLFKPQAPPKSKQGPYLLNKEQIKTRLLAKREAYRSGMLACRPFVVKSLIKSFVSMLTTKAEANAYAHMNLSCKDVPSKVSCPLL